MIIDAHAHYGHDYVFDEDNFEDTLVEWSDRCSIDYTIVQPSIPRPYIKDTIEVHNKIYELCKKYNGRFIGMASITPHFKPQDYDREITRCIKELGFVGVKITPLGHSAHPGLKSCEHVYEMCRVLQIPVMIHTGLGTPFADPFHILAPAKVFTDVKFIIAHAGSDTLFHTALYVSEECPNVYLEPSWLNIYYLKQAIDRIGPERIMFSSDMPMNIPVELTKYRAVTKDAEVLEQLLYLTAKNVFNLKI